MKTKVLLIMITCFCFTLLVNRGNTTSTAMWDWSYKSAIDASQRAELIAFCQKNGIQRIFLQISYAFVTSKNGTVECTIHNPKEAREFLADAHKAGLKIDAMDGASNFALKPWHPYVLSQVDSIIAFNKAGKPNERYDGIHYDIEPYTLKEFRTGQKESISLQYLELMSKIAAKMKKSGMYFGIAIPFWLEQPGDDGKINVVVTWNKQEKPLSYHLLDIVDEIAIMDYRTQAEGDNGTIRHAKDEIAYADKVQKKVWVGLETSEVRGDPPTISFFGHPVSDLNQVRDATVAAFKNNPSFLGIALHHYGSLKPMFAPAKTK
jgi:hypothetical protein